jgi:hypothetical protein
MIKKENLVQEIKRVTEDRDRSKGYSPARQSAIFWQKKNGK